MPEEQENCCYSGYIMDPALNDLKEARMDTYNKDLRNVGLCLKVIEVNTGKEMADKLREQAIHYLKTGQISPP